MPGAAEEPQAAQLPAVAQGGAVVPKSEEHAIAEIWAPAAKLPMESLVTIARVFKTSFPDWGLAEIVMYVDILGHKPRFNAQFYIDTMNNHPATETSPETEELQPDHGDWPFYMKDTPAAAVADAEKARVKRRDRTHPQEEASHVLVTDTILWNWEELSELGREAPRPAAVEAARKIVVARMGKDRLPFAQGTIRVSQGKYGWSAWVPRVDWRAQAGKKARTTALRRTLTRAYSLQDMKAVIAARRAELAIEGVVPQLVPGAPEPPEALTKPQYPDDPYAVTDEKGRTQLRQRWDANHAAAVTAASREPGVDEALRRKLHAFASDYDFGELGDTHQALKYIIAEQKGVSVEDTSTLDLTLEDYTNVVEAIAQNYALKQPIEGKVREVEVKPEGGTGPGRPGSEAPPDQEDLPL